jgi:hypothetical protein
VSIEVAREEFDLLAEHGQIPIAFEVSSVLDLTVADGGLGGFVLRERQLAVPYTKDYDKASAQISRPLADAALSCVQACALAQASATAKSREPRPRPRTSGAMRMSQITAKSARRSSMSRPSVLKATTTPPALRASIQAERRAQFAMSRDAERQRARVPVLRPPGMHAVEPIGSHRCCSLCAPGRNAKGKALARGFRYRRPFSVLTVPWLAPEGVSQSRRGYSAARAGCSAPGCVVTCRRTRSTCPRSS